MKIHAFSDLHLHNHPEFSRPFKPGCNNRLRDGLNVLRQIFQRHWDLGIETPLLFLGDFFHIWRESDPKIRIHITRELYDLMDEFPIELWMLVGNHDMWDKENSTQTTVYDYSGHPRIKVITEPKLLEVGDQACAFLPYNEDQAVLVQESRRLHNRGAHYLFSHLDLVGAKAGMDGYVSKNGISLEFLSTLYQGGMFGHYHQFQHWNVSDSSFAYVGNPLQTWRIDRDCSKGTLVYNTSKQTFKLLTYDETPKLHEVDGTEENEFNLKDYYWIRIPRSRATELTRHYDNLGIVWESKIIEDNPTNKIRFTLKQNVDPIHQYAQDRGDGLDPEILVNIGRSYMEG